MYLFNWLLLTELRTRPGMNLTFLNQSVPVADFKQIMSSPGFLGGSVVKNQPAMQETKETWVQSLDVEDALEKEMVTHSSILAWKIPWTEEPGGLQSLGSQELDMI